MQSIIYDVAVSVDGYIAGPNGDVSGFAHQGPVVDDYKARLSVYACAIMGRETYEFGYRFGLQPGQNPYPSMQCIVVSSTLKLPDDSNVTVLERVSKDRIDVLRHRMTGPIYLCGGGVFASTILEMGKIDRLCLKRAPLLLGGGTPLFSGISSMPALSCVATKTYAGGYLFQEFEVAKSG